MSVTDISKAPAEQVQGDQHKEREDLPTKGPLDTALRNVERAEGHLKQVREAEAAAEREVARAIEELRDAERQFVTVHVVHVNEVEHASFEEKRIATLQQVWDKSYEELNISRNPKDVFQTAGEHPVSLMTHLGLSLEEAHRERVIKDNRFGIASETGALEMATVGMAPTADPLAGAAALDEDIPRVLKLEQAPSLEALGWSRPNRSTLLVPMRGFRSGVTDEFLLRLGFQAYRKWPPSAQFVNPVTKAYSYPLDQHHVPMLTSPECHTHTAYPRNPGTIQLVCCSATLEFYDVLHSVEQQLLWRETNTFFTTLFAIRRAFASHYQGRFPVHGT